MSFLFWHCCFYQLLILLYICVVTYVRVILSILFQVPVALRCLGLFPFCISFVLDKFSFLFLVSIDGRLKVVSCLCVFVWLCTVYYNFFVCILVVSGVFLLFCTFFNSCYLVIFLVFRVILSHIFSCHVVNICYLHRYVLLLQWQT